MKNLIVLFIANCFCLQLSFSQKNDSLIEDYISKGDMIQLYNQLPALEGEASEFMQLYAHSILYTYFNKPQKGIETIHTLLSKYTNQLGYEITRIMATFLADNYIKIGDFASAHSIYEQLLSQVGSSIDELTLKTYKQHKEMWGAMSTLPPMQINTHKTYSIPYRTDSLGFITLQLNAGNKQQDLVLDFGADMNLIHEKYANDLGIILTDASTSTGGQSVENQNTRLGYAPEIKIGNLVLKNVPFAVSVNPLLENLPIDYEMKGVIGLSVFQNFNTLKFDQMSKTLSINTLDTTYVPANMTIINQKIFVKTYSGSDTLLMLFDTGGGETSLSKTYYEKHKNILTGLDSNTIKLIGYGGEKISKTYTIPNFKLDIGKYQHSFDKIQLYLDYLGDEWKIEGVMGIDVFNSAKGMTMDLKNMHITYY